MMKQRVLVYEHLSAGGEGIDRQLLAEGAAMRDAIVDGLTACRDLEVRWVAPAGAGLEGRGPVAPGPGESLSDFVVRAARAHDAVWLVAPETGGLLADFCARIEASRWIGCELETVRLASAKQATLVQLARHGLCTPLSFEGASEVTRWVVKPDDGAGAVNTRVHAGLELARADMRRRREAGERVTLEPWVPGQALSLSLLCGAGSVELLSVNAQHLVVGPDGMVSFRGVRHEGVARDTPRWRALHRVALQAAQALPGLRGFVGIDLVWHLQRGPVVIEVNPRVTSAFVGLAERLGRPLAVEILACCRSREACDEPN